MPGDLPIARKTNRRLPAWGTIRLSSVGLSVGLISDPRGLKGLRVVEFDDASPHRSQRHLDQALSFLLAKCSNSGCIRIGDPGGDKMPHRDRVLHVVEPGHTGREENA